MQLKNYVHTDLLNTKKNKTLFKSERSGVGIFNVINYLVQKITKYKKG